MAYGSNLQRQQLLRQFRHSTGKTLHPSFLGEPSSGEVLRYGIRHTLAHGC